MALPPLSTRQLTAFVALADLSSFTRAAEACHLSQPAFSALIQGLEESLGTRLFDRHTRSVQLSAEGRLFALSARQLLGDFQRAVTDLRDHVERRKGRVHIAALPSLAAGWLPGIFRTFRDTWPGIELSLSDTLSDSCIDLVRSSKADFALASDASGVPGLSSRLLCADKFWLVCRKGHPLARQPALTLKDVAREPFIHLSRNSSVRQALEAALHPLKANTVLEVDQLATVMGMVEAGLGVSVIPALTLFHFDRPSLVCRELAGRGLERRIHLVRRGDAALSSAAHALHDLVVREMQALDAGRAQRGLRRTQA